MGEYPLNSFPVAPASYARPVIKQQGCSIGGLIIISWAQTFAVIMYCPYNGSISVLHEKCVGHSFHSYSHTKCAATDLLLQLPMGNRLQQGKY